MKKPAIIVAVLLVSGAARAAEFRANDYGAKGNGMAPNTTAIQSAIDAALQLRGKVGHVKNVKSIDIHTFDAAVDIIGKDPEKWRPRTRETADHSLPYCTAVALADGDVTLAQFAPERFTDAALMRQGGQAGLLAPPASPEIWLTHAGAALR